MVELLTHREREIVLLVFRGYSAKEIARQLGIANRTVEHHISNLRCKFHARNTAHLVALAIAYMNAEQSVTLLTAA